jgi:hypothetical protein
MKKAAKPPKAATELPYKRTPEEDRALVAQLERRRRLAPMPQLAVKASKGANELSYDHPDISAAAAMNMEALSLGRVPEYLSLLQHVARLNQKDGKVEAAGINEMLAQIAAIQPRDGVEAMLATQMVVVHNAAMKQARLLRGSETIPQQDSNSTAFNKLTRTFAMQLEALKRYRSKGEQRVIIERVTVNEGGQAIVGAVSSGEGVPK